MTEPADRLFTDARVVLPAGQVLEGWLAVKDGRVASVGESTAPPTRSRVSCHGNLLLPGLVDVHVHFRDPGFTYKEDFLTGSAAAAFGGVTTVIDMPNTGHFVLTPADLKAKIDYLNGRSFVDFGLYALLANSADQLAELQALGVAGLKWLLGYLESHGIPVQPSSKAALRAALLRAAELDLLVGVHAESYPWISDLGEELRQQGRTDPQAHGASRPPFVEGLATAEACLLAAEFDCRLHVHHLSSARALSVARILRQHLGAAVTTETCPHYLFLTEEDARTLGTKARVNPPLRAQADVEAMWAGIESGEIDCVASDHAPHALHEKDVGSIWEAESGLIGVETLFPMLFHEVCTGRLSLRRFVEVTAERPAAIVGLATRKGALLPGHDADMLLVDPDQRIVITNAKLHSKYPDSVYDGLARQGAITAVYLRGQLVVADGRLTGPPGGAYTPSARNPPVRSRHVTGATNREVSE